MKRVCISFTICVFLAATCAGQMREDFSPLEHWQSAVIEGNAAELESLYSAAPPAQINTTAGKFGGDADVAFWAGLKVKSMNISMIKSGSPQPGIHRVLFQAEVKTRARTMYLTAEQVWQMQSGVWRLVAESRELSKLQQPLTIDEDIYPDGDARAEIRAAVRRAGKEHKRVLLVFGADWCYDCHVLDKAFRRRDIAPVLRAHYEVVHVDVGRFDKNLDLMEKYGVPIKRGVPAVAVLDGNGRLLYSQKNGEWEQARALGPEDLLALLNKWKAGA
jgi:Thioredoxin-like